MSRDLQTKACRERDTDQCGHGGDEVRACSDRDEHRENDPTQRPECGCDVTGTAQVAGTRETVEPRESCRHAAQCRSKSSGPRG